MANEPNKKPLHAGHRARMREKMAEFGTEGFADHEILEMLLYYAVPRGDTNAIAHELLDRFRDFRGFYAGGGTAPGAGSQRDPVRPDIGCHFGWLYRLHSL